jgi:hypothetical protein
MNNNLLMCALKVLEENRHEQKLISAVHREWTSNFVSPGFRASGSWTPPGVLCFPSGRDSFPAIAFRVTAGDRLGRASRRRDGARQVNPTCSIRDRHHTLSGHPADHVSSQGQAMATITRGRIECETTGNFIPCHGIRSLEICLGGVSLNSGFITRVEEK